MKTSRIIIAAFAAALSLVSCTKENADQKNSSSTSEPRVFTLEFSKQTRTTLGSDGITPEWTNGDKIWISNDQSGEEVSVTVSGDKATITTTLKGTLKAVYPSSAATKNGTVITGISVPANQHGTFAESNICMAEDITESAEIITFVNKTAVLCFYVDASIGVKSITVQSSNDNIATDSQIITVDPDGEVTLDTVTDDPKKRVCYVAALSGTSTSTLTFTSVTTTQTTYENYTVAREVSGAKLAVNTLYNAFIPYYIDLGDAGKWGYCNVGAFLPEEYGEYFAWGGTTGYQANVSVKTFEHSFSWTNCPFSNQDEEDIRFHKYVPEDYSVNYGIDGHYDNKDTLDPEDDAATKNWGSSWRMPTIQEFSDLLSTTNTGNSDFRDGILTIKDHPSLIFPAAGMGNGKKLTNAGSQGYYWSSSLNTTDPSGANYFSCNASMSSYERSRGLSVRPVFFSSN